MVKIPRDFIVDKAKLSRKQIERRYLKVGDKFFHKGKAGQNNHVSLDEFEKRYYRLRDLLGLLAKVRIKALWLSRFNTRYPNFTFGRGGERKVMSVSDFLECICITETYDDHFREMVHIVQNVMWGSSNHWALHIEAIIMAIVGLAYSDEYLGDATAADLEDDLEDEETTDGTTKDEFKPKRKHLGGSIRQLVVARKGRICNQPVTRKLVEVRQEKLYKRNVGTNKKVVKVKQASSYDGFIGLCANHPEILASSVIIHRAKDEQASFVTGDKPPANQSQVRAWFESLAAKGMQSLEEFVKAAQHQIDSAPIPFPLKAVQRSSPSNVTTPNGNTQESDVSTITGGSVSIN